MRCGLWIAWCGSCITLAEYSCVLPNFQQHAKSKCHLRATATVQSIASAWACPCCILYIYILMIWEEWTSEATWSDQFIGSIKITVFLTLITCIIKTILHSFFFAVIQGVRVCVVCVCGLAAAHMVGSSILNCNRLVDRLTLLPLYNQSFVRSFRLSVHLVDESDCKMDIYL